MENIPQLITFIINLRKRGEINKALELAEKLYKENQGRVDVSETLFWCLYSKAKSLAQASELEVVLLRMRKLAQGSTKAIVIKALEATEERCRQIAGSFEALNEAYENGTLATADHDRFGEAILNELKENVPVDDCEKRSELLNRYLELKLPRPSAQHSRILGQALRFEYFSPLLFRFSEYFKKWGGADSFMPSDWVAQKNSTPLVEKAIAAYTQEILIGKDLYPEPFFFDLLDKAIGKWFKNKSLPIYKELLRAKEQSADNVKKQNSDEERFKNEALKNRELVQRALERKIFVERALGSIPFVQEALKCEENVDRHFFEKVIKNSDFVEDVLAKCDFVKRVLENTAIVNKALETKGKSVPEKEWSADEKSFIERALKNRELVQTVLNDSDFVKSALGKKDTVQKVQKNIKFVDDALKDIDFIHEVIGSRGFVKRALEANNKEKGFIQDVLNNLQLFKNLKYSRLCKKIFVAWNNIPQEKDLIKVAKDLGFDEERFVFVDYRSLKKANPLDGKYGLILAGPGPHSTPSTKGKSSALVNWETNGYPYVIRLLVNGTLRVSMKNFKEALENAMARGIIVPDNKPIPHQ